MDKLTSKFQTALADAQSLALGQDHAVIEPIHVMKVLLDEKDGSISSMLAKANVNLPQLRSQIEAAAVDHAEMVVIGFPFTAVIRPPQIGERGQLNFSPLKRRRPFVGTVDPHHIFIRGGSSETLRKIRKV